MVSALYWLPDLLTRSPRPTTPTDVLSAQNAVRETCIAALVALGTAFTAAIAWRTYMLQRSGQFTERYSAAVGQLGAELMEMRIGGIYALESLMRESFVDAPAVVQVLAAFLRNRAVQLTAARGLLPLPAPGEALIPIRAPQDIEATVVVLGRRGAEIGEQPLDLRGANLSGVEANGSNPARAWLHQADLSRAHFRSALLRGAGLNATDLRSAVFDRSDMSESRMDRANLSGASLIEVRLQRARILSADLTAVMLYGADLDNVDLRGSCLRGARLDAASLRGACLDKTDLTGANLTACDLTGASLRGARLTGTRLDRGSVTPKELFEAVDADAVAWNEGDPLQGIRSTQIAAGLDVAKAIIASDSVGKG
jgi:uncharacterized protein YjbI with pentapeptide repeats